jgi:hypothetical protein
MKVDNMIIKNLGIYRRHQLRKRIFFTEANIKGENEPKQDQAFYISILLMKSFSLIPYICIVSFDMAKKLPHQAKTRKETSRAVYTSQAVFCACELPFKAMFDSLSFVKQAFDFELYYIC